MQPSVSVSSGTFRQSEADGQPKVSEVYSVSLTHISEPSANVITVSVFAIEHQPTGTVNFGQSGHLMSQYAPYNASHSL